MSSTKKLPVAISLPSGRSKGSEFLIPDPAGAEGFISLKTGRRVPYGLLVYTGTEITALELFDRAAEQSIVQADNEQFRRSIEIYVDVLQDFRIGNVLRAAGSGRETVALEKVADRPPPESAHPRLP